MEVVCDSPTYEVTVLREGFYKFENGRARAQCTVTLVKGPKRIIVDPGSAWDTDWLVSAMWEKGNLRPDDIDYVICTHGHSDHIGNLHLFRRATHIIGCDIQTPEGQGQEFLCHDFADPFEIDNDVRVVATPGHTSEDVSVLVRTGSKNMGCVAIAGDLFESEKDFEEPEMWQQWSRDERTQMINRDRILSKAQFIVPGHGAMFRVEAKHLSTPAITEVSDD